jgi:membrane-bound ClpP family serine protease
MSIVRLLAGAFAVLVLIVLPLIFVLAHSGMPTFAILITAVIVQCSGVFYFLRRRKS